jgi:hypothetical protein
VPFVNLGRSTMRFWSNRNGAGILSFFAKGPYEPLARGFGPKAFEAGADISAFGRRAADSAAIEARFRHGRSIRHNTSSASREPNGDAVLFVRYLHCRCPSGWT